MCKGVKDKQVYVYKQNELSPDGWELVDKKELFSDMIRKQTTTLGQIKDYNIKEDNPLEIKDYTGFNNLIKELNTKETKQEFINKINNICYQNKAIVQKTRKEIDTSKKQKLLKNNTV